MDWTSKQLDVINTRNRNILVSAAAGSGKTAVLVERIIHLITDNSIDVNVDELLVVTFTKAAASEMKERLRERLEELMEKAPDDNIEKQLALLNNATISTIDSFCSKVVKENFDKVDIDPGYRLADESEIDLLRNDILDEILEEYYLFDSEEFISLAKKYSNGKVYDNIADLVNCIYRKAKGAISPEKWVDNLEKCYNFQTEDDIANSEVLNEVYQLCIKQLKECKDKLEEAVQIAAEDEEVSYLVDNSKELIAVVDLLLECNDYIKLHHTISHITLPTVTRKYKGNKQIVKSAKALMASALEMVKKMLDLYFSESITDMIENGKNCRDTVHMLSKITGELINRFSEAKKEKRIADFDDIARMALNILNDIDEDGSTHPTKVARQMSKSYKEIMIDEYQDSNFVQEAILTSVSRGQGINNMFMVGDVKQSIYRFRNAKSKLFLDKFDTYEENLEADNCKIILDQNFRSRSEVIDSVNFLFDHIMSKELGGIDYKDGNGLKLGAKYEDVPEGQDNHTEFITIGTDSKEMEAAYVAAKIKEITDPVKGLKIEGKDNIMRPAEYKDIALILRSVKGNGNIYLEALENAGIPAYAESKIGYYDSLEIRTIMDMLSIIDNPRQDIPLVGVMTSAMFHFNDEELASIKSENTFISFYDNVCMYADNGDDDTLVEKVKNFIDMLNYFRSLDCNNSVYDIINEILGKTGFGYYVSALTNGKRRFLNIENLKEKAISFEKTSYRGLFNFVRYIEKVKETAKDEGEASVVNENDNIVRITTIHKSKGLQYPIVFLCDTNSRFVTDNKAINIFDDGQVGLDAIYPDRKITVTPMYRKYIRNKIKEEEYSENLKLLYVALTRAKEKLYITGMVKNLNKYKDEIENIRDKDSEFLTYSELMNCSSFFKWMSLIYNRENPFVKCIHVEEEEIQIEKANAFIRDEIKKKMLKQWKGAEVPKDIFGTITSNFEFDYSYKEEINLCAKASVTELKKESLADEEAQKSFENKYIGDEIIIPKFMKDEPEEEMAIAGAERGTAYHRFFELMQMDLDSYDENTIKEMVARQVADNKLSKVQSESIDTSDILTFTKSNVFLRMKEAYSREELYRERQFLLGVPADLVKDNCNSKEIMIIQGIIDVCFIEDGKYVIMDYKTDKVKTMNELKEKYAKQLESYKLALERITDIPVSEMIIYSVYLGDEISI